MDNYSTEEYEREKLKKNEHFKSAVSLVRSVSSHVVDTVYEECTYVTQERIPEYRRYGASRYEDVRHYLSNEKEKYSDMIYHNASQFLNDIVGFFREKNETFISIPKYCYIWKQFFHKVVPQMFKKWEIETCKNEWN